MALHNLHGVRKRGLDKLQVAFLGSHDTLRNDLGALTNSFSYVFWGLPGLFLCHGLTPCPLGMRRYFIDKICGSLDDYLPERQVRSPPGIAASPFESIAFWSHRFIAIGALQAHKTVTVIDV